jgi:hypothetical protein
MSHVMSALRYFRLLPLLWLFASLPVSAQFRQVETENLRLIYLPGTPQYLVDHVARSFENSLAMHRRLLNYTPTERTTVLMHDMYDVGSAGADVMPRNFVILGIAPLSYVFETSPANERINALMHHEMVHIAGNDQAGRYERLFRRLFTGKVAPSAEDPLSMFYSYLTAPRRYAPGWYQEGVAVFMETWMAGGLGRALGGYDEMVFRTRVLEDAHIYDIVGLDSEGREVDFQVGVNSYLYGTRFMSYLAYEYGPERVIEWFTREVGSRAAFAAQFRQVFGKSLNTSWKEWIEFERRFQAENLERIGRTPLSPYREIARHPLGSISKTYFDADRNVLYAAVNYPGQIAHLAAINVETGDTRRLVDIKGPNLYSVSSIAHDPDHRQIFYTTDNQQQRSLWVYDLDTGRSRKLMHRGRIGDLAYDRTDRSLWGIRRYLGISTLVRIPYPYTQWNQIRSWPYGQDFYDLDLSPDGSFVVGSLAQVDGSQQLIRMSVSDLRARNYQPDVLFDFDVSNPESFAHSSDGRYLYGSSYYSGVSNIYRYDLEERRMQALSNARTGFFRPVPLANDSLAALMYTSDGFIPVLLPDQPVSRVGAIAFLGQRVVEKHPIVKDWVAPPPSVISLDSVVVNRGPYSSMRHFRPSSVYPVVQGYKDYVGIGLRMDLRDDTGLYRANVSASFTPSESLPGTERLHLAFQAFRYNWSLFGGYNRADFYDLFGPTRSSRKGYFLGVSYRGHFVYDGPRTFEYRGSVTGYGGLERLPDYQNVRASFSEMISVSGSLRYQNVRRSIGAVDGQKGIIASIKTGANLVNRTAYPRLQAEYHLGTPLPLKHSSFWLRTYAGQSVGDRTNPFANFYLGGFGNNWVDHRDIRRYHADYAFPGIGLNALAGTNYARATGELLLPPLRFRDAGVQAFYLKWARLALFTSGAVTNFDTALNRTTAYNVGGQVDFRLMFFSHLQTTLSVGVAGARTSRDYRGMERMISLKIL